MALVAVPVAVSVLLAAAPAATAATAATAAPAATPVNGNATLLSVAAAPYNRPGPVPFEGEGAALRS